MIQTSDCHARTSPNSHCVAKFYEGSKTIPPDDLNATLGQKSPIVNEDLQADFQ